jgi:hypothetical protein
LQCTIKLFGCRQGCKSTAIGLPTFVRSMKKFLEYRVQASTFSVNIPSVGAWHNPFDGRSSQRWDSLHLSPGDVSLNCLLCGLHPKHLSPVVLASEQTEVLG